MMELGELLTSNRRNDANFHLEQGHAWQQIGIQNQLHTPLVYAAFEYRCSIERIILELYDLMKDLKLTQEEVSKLKDTAKVVKKVLQLVGGTDDKLARALRFNTVYTQEMIADFAGLTKEISEPDVRRLINLLGRLSEYCHRQVIPDDTWDSNEWVQRGYDLLEEVRMYLWELKVDKHFGYVAESTMPPEAQELKHEFMDGKVDEEGLRTRLRLMKPIIEGRKGRP